ncbi:flagellar basal-body MS-ring/collar protein FliF [Comamonas sediminis]|uniref:Flagellar M-ring protein n=1 Tax=Comamonas sediminis TaxID=1783360 RepID=A0ABV4B3J2_9BURK
MIAFWESMSRPARAGLVVGSAGIVLATAIAGWWLLRSDYQVLFSDLNRQDAAAMMAELEKLKVPYQFDENSASIMVDKAQVHPTRIKLMGKELPLHGAVGFELFNNTDFGMTEFAQKINFQRALQGELTRTILSLSEIQDVRVHLALPEQGLFKQASSKAKAAVTVTLREGRSLKADQVAGIQRLVAAATPGMTPQDVTVLDKQGVALSRAADDTTDNADFVGSSSRLELKKETETLLTRKAAAVLDQAFGAGQALASVDVTLNMEQVRTTTEDIIPASARAGESKGVIVKERESVRDGNGLPLDTARRGSGNSSSTQREVDYQVGRRVEQTVSQAGSVRRINLVAVVRQPLDNTQEDKLRRVLAAAVGANPERGDTIVVQSLQAWIAPPAAEQSPTLARHTDMAQPVETYESPRASASAQAPVLYTYVRTIGVAAILLLVLLLVVLILRKRPAAQSSVRAPHLTDAERAEALRQVQQWMQDSAPTRPRQSAAMGQG